VVRDHDIEAERTLNTDIAHRQTLSDLLRRSARRHPDKTAIVCGDIRWTYAEFDALCGRLASGLAGLGIGKGDRVAVLARNSHAFAALRFALARIGAVLVPINFMLKAGEVAYILRHSGAGLLATDSGLAALAREAAAHDTSVERFVWLPAEEPSRPEPGMLSFDALADTAAPPPDVPLAGSDLLQIVYTSGTESSPKGAMLTHEAVISQYVSCLVDARSRAPTSRCMRCRSSTARSSTCSSGRRSTPAPSTSSPPGPRPTTCCR
jgi:fatty-acyl-CoA synthase